MAKIGPDLWDECRATAERKARPLTYEDLSVLLLGLALGKESDQYLTSTALGKAAQGTMAVGSKNLNKDNGLPPRMVAT